MRHGLWSLSGTLLRTCTPSNRCSCHRFQQGHWEGWPWVSPHQAPELWCHRKAEQLDPELASRWVVVVYGEQSGPVPVIHAVPQGSVLGPCPFLFVVNTMAEKLQTYTECCRWCHTPWPASSNLRREIAKSQRSPTITVAWQHPEWMSSKAIMCPAYWALVPLWGIAGLVESLH